MLVIWTGYRDRKALCARKTGGGSFGELASGVYYVGCHVFGGEFGGYGYLGDDMLHLWKREDHKSEAKLGVFSERNTGTDVGYECLLDERGDNGTFTNTLWDVFKFGNADHGRKKKTRTVTD